MLTKSKNIHLKTIDKMKNKEFELLKLYSSWYIDRLYPTTLEFKIENWIKKGFIDYGSTPNQLPNFETWKKFNS